MTNLNKIALVISQFNEPITSIMKAQAIDAFDEIFDKEHQLVIYEVPGAVELPFIQQQVILHDVSVKGVLVMGCVIQGETDHYDYVCQMVSKGCMDVSLKHHVPMGFGVITAQNFKLAKARCSEEKSKARETVQALYNLMQINKVVKEA